MVSQSISSVPSNDLGAAPITFFRFLTPNELMQLAEDQNNKVIVVDVSGREDFTKGHIKIPYGATVNAPLFFDYRFREKAETPEEMVFRFQTYLTELGVTGQESLVFTEKSPLDSWGAALRGSMLTILSGYPRDQVYVLEGGNEAWHIGKGDVGEGIVIPAKGSFISDQPDFSFLATAKDVLAFSENPQENSIIVDTRHAPEWIGQNATPYPVDVDVRAGRIPGENVVNCNFEEFLERRGDGVVVLKDAAVLKGMYADMGIKEDTNVIGTCFKCAREMHDAAAREKAGLPIGKFYLEGMYGWGSNQELPMDHGLPSLERTFGKNREELRDIIQSS